jgi:hypothetical protein
MFLEIRRNLRTGEVESEREITKEELIKAHPNNYEVRGWAEGARKGSPFSVLSKGLFYKKL